jgi:hypothetical protein
MLPGRGAARRRWSTPRSLPGLAHRDQPQPHLVVARFRSVEGLHQLGDRTLGPHGISPCTVTEQLGQRAFEVLQHRRRSRLGGGVGRQRRRRSRWHRADREQLRGEDAHRLREVERSLRARLRGIAAVRRAAARAVRRRTPTSAPRDRAHRRRPRAASTRAHPAAARRRCRPPRSRRRPLRRASRTAAPPAARRRRAPPCGRRPPTSRSASRRA